MKNKTHLELTNERIYRKVQSSGIQTSLSKSLDVDEDSDVSDGEGYLDPKDESMKLIRLRQCPTRKTSVISLFNNTDKASYLDISISLRR